MDNGIVTMQREFSYNSQSLKDEYKYVVKYYADGISLQYLEFNEETKQFDLKQDYFIDAMTAELFFKTIAKDFEDGNIIFE